MRRYLGERHDLATEVSVLGPAGFAGAASRFLWKERRESDFKAHPPACDACAARDRCEGAWIGYLDIHGADELRPLRAPLAGRT